MNRLFQRITLTMILAASILLTAITAFAQTASTQGSPVLVSSFPVKITTVHEQPDELGTDTSNMYTFTLDYADARYASGNVYKIVYSEDGKIQQVLHKTPLPLTLSRDFKAYPDGQHTVHFEVASGKDIEVAHQSATITVAH